MNNEIKLNSKKIFDRANISNNQIFGSFYLSRLLGLNIKNNENLCIVEFDSIPNFFNPQGTLHGGIISTIMDISMGHLIKNEQGTGTTLELKVNFLLPIKKEKIKCEGSYIKKGKTISIVKSSLYREDGRLSAYATSTWKIL